ncbi:MAG: hypothetical protein ACP5PT_04975 [Brevinematia bacterium]
MFKVKNKLLSVALAFSVLSQPGLSKAQSGTDKELKLYLDGIQSAKDRGVFQDRGVLFAVYDLYGKRLKMFHYWVAIGNQKNDGLTNTQCGTGATSINVIGALRLKDPKRKVDGLELLDYNCLDKAVGDRTLKYCTSDKGSFYYDPTDGNIVNVTPINGFICRRQVNDVVLKQARIKVNYDSNSDTIYNVGQVDALEIVAKYAYYNKIQYALFVVETYDVKIDESGSFPNKKVIYRYYENPKYYGIVAGINTGTPLGYGYYMVNGQGIGNRFDRSYNEIFTESKSGSFAGTFLMNSMLLTIGQYYGATGLTTTARSILDVSDIMKEKILSNDSNIITGGVASELTERVSSGSSLKLRGFVEHEREMESYQDWKKNSGGFIQLPSQITDGGQGK